MGYLITTKQNSLPSFIGRYAHIKRERKCIIGFEKYKLIETICKIFKKFDKHMSKSMHLNAPI
jgi:hypothetical protein